MRKTINGKRYDTDKSQLIATYDSGHYASDFHWYVETLYKTPRGRLFILGEGNALSRYASRTGDHSGSGSAIIELDVDDAVKWLADTDNEAAIDAHFEDVIQDA